MKIKKGNKYQYIGNSIPLQSIDVHTKSLYKEFKAIKRIAKTNFQENRWGEALELWEFENKKAFPNGNPCFLNIEMKNINNGFKKICKRIIR